MCGGGGGGNPITKSVDSIKKRGKEVGKAGSQLVSGDFKGAGKTLLKSGTKALGASTVTSAFSEGADKVGDIKNAQESAINAAQSGADAAREQVNIQREQIAETRKEKAKELESRDQEAAALAAGKKRDTARRRQRTRSLGARGRRSTILTTGNEAQATGIRKTLLGQ